MHVQIRDFTYDVRVQNLYVNTEKIQPREGRRIRKEKTVHLSDWFKVGQNHSKARPSRKKQVYLGLFEPKSVTMSAWPIAGSRGVFCTCFSACNVADFGRKVARYIYLILAKTVFLFIALDISVQGDALNTQQTG